MEIRVSVVLSPKLTFVISNLSSWINLVWFCLPVKQKSKLEMKQNSPNTLPQILATDLHPWTVHKDPGCNPPSSTTTLWSVHVSVPSFWAQEPLPRTSLPLPSQVPKCPHGWFELHGVITQKSYWWDSVWVCILESPSQAVQLVGWKVAGIKPRVLW